MVEQGLISRALFSVYMTDDTQDKSKVGEILFGEIDETKFVGNLSWVPLAGQDYWRIKVDQIKVDGMTGPFCVGGCFGAVDTGTSLIVGPASAMSIINHRLGAFELTKGIYTFVCEDAKRLPSVEFKINGKSYVLEPRDYIMVQQVETLLGTRHLCVSSFQGHPAADNGVWIIGDTFLRKFYTVYDFEKKRVGFAKAKKYLKPKYHFF